MNFTSGWWARKRRFCEESIEKVRIINCGHYREVYMYKIEGTERYPRSLLKS